MLLSKVIADMQTELAEHGDAETYHYVSFHKVTKTVTRAVWLPQFGFYDIETGDSEDGLLFDMDTRTVTKM